MFAPSDSTAARHLATAHTELDELLAAPLFTLSDADLEAHQVAVRRLVHKALSHDLAVTAESVTRGLDTKTVMVRDTHQNSASAHRRIKLAQALASHEVLRTAMATGEVSEAQAAAILDAVAAIPVDDPRVGADVPARAETLLVDLAARHTPKELTALGRRILEAAAPDIADELLGEQLQREHDQARRDTRLTIYDDAHGRTHLRGTVPASVGAMIRRNLRALIAPKHVRATTPAEHDTDGDTNGEGWALLRKPSPERWGQAFVEWVERYPTTHLPKSGGVQARAMVSLDHQQLLDALGASAIASIDGVPIPAGEARRLACEAGLLPLVLGGKSIPLDLGRTKRFHDTGQRLTMEIRDKTCTTAGCDVPAALCHAHHVIAWSEGGGTSVEAGRLLCPRHHHLAHHPKWEMTKTKHGQVTFIRR